MKTVCALVVSGALVWMCALPASGGSLVTSLGSLTQNDMVNWGQFGPSGTDLDPGSAPYVLAAFFSSSSNTITVNSNAPMYSQTASVTGIPGSLLAVDNQFSGPVTIVFDVPVSAFGFYINNEFGNSYIAQVATENASFNPLQTYTEGASGNNAEFFGVQDATADMKEIVISLMSTVVSGENNYFSFGTLYAENAVSQLPVTPIGVTQSGAPEPSTWLLAGSALAVVIGLRRRARKSGSASMAGRLV